MALPIPVRFDSENLFAPYSGSTQIIDESTLDLLHKSLPHSELPKAATVKTRTYARGLMLAVTGVFGTFRLPRYALPFSVTQHDLNVSTASESSPHLYVGYHSPAGRFGIDAGLQFNRAGNGLPDRWQAVLRVNDGRPQKEQYIGSGIEIDRKSVV